MTDAVRARPRVTALMPAWNASAFIEPVLRSLAAQTYPNLQVLIADDASTDDTFARCERFAATRADVVVHRQPRNGGWVDNTNWLLARADGDYLFFAFHDDPLDPAYVERLVDALEAAPQAVLAFSDITVEQETKDGHRVGIASFAALDGLAAVRDRYRVMRTMEGYWWVPNRGLVRRSAAARVGGLRHNFADDYSADWPWLLHLALLGPFVRVPEPLIYKRMRLKGLSLTWRRSARTRLAVVLSVAREIATADLAWPLRAHLLADFVGHWVGRFARKLLVNPLGKD